MYNTINMTREFDNYVIEKSWRSFYISDIKKPCTINDIIKDCDTMLDEWQVQPYIITIDKIKHDSFHIPMHYQGEVLDKIKKFNKII